MRLAFMGTPEFAVPALRALHDAGHDIAAVYCQPPRPAGRGQVVHPSAVQSAAEKLGLPVRTPVRLRSNIDAHAAFQSLQLDVAVVAAYGQILPASMLQAPRLGCLNIHASLLPRWRGAAPIQASILAGDNQSGITIMQMDERLDAGDILVQGSIPITHSTTSALLHDQLAVLGAELITATLLQIPSPQRQSEDDATYAPKLDRENGRIDWTKTSSDLDRQIRAFDPWPGSYTTLSGQILKVLAGHIVDCQGPNATVIDHALTVACGFGAIRITRLQLAGRAPLSAEAFLRGNPIPPGTILGT
jgi:methionyl-tRNA formyltransferase